MSIISLSMSCLEANEEISTSVNDENIQLVYQLIDYYGKEDNDLRKRYLVIGQGAFAEDREDLLVRNVVSLQRVIDNSRQERAEL